MAPKGYRGVTLPKEMIDTVELLIKQKPELGFSTPTEFVKDAIRKNLSTREITPEEEKVLEKLRLKLASQPKSKD